MTVKKENYDALAILLIYQLHPLPFYLTPQIRQPLPLLMHIAKPVITHGPPAVFNSMPEPLASTPRLMFTYRMFL